MEPSYPLLSYLALIGILLFTSCSPFEDDNSLIDKHTNMLRCKVNGMEWIPERPDIRSPIQLQYYDDVKGFVLSAERESTDQSINQYFTFSSYNIVEKEKNSLRPQTTTFLDFKKLGNCTGYDLDTTNSDNHVYIESIEEENRTIRGSFYFQVYDHDCDERITISDGEFDLAY